MRAVSSLAIEKLPVSRTMSCNLTPTTIVLLVLYPSLLNLVLWRHKAEAVSQTQLHSLMDFLFTDYRPEVRPTTVGEETFLYVALHLLSIQGLDEKSQQLESSVIVEAFWVDDWLSWNRELYGNVSEFLYPQSKIWLPDLIIENSVTSQRQLGYNMNLVRVTEEGFIHWKPSEVIKTACDIDVTYYPFDTQTCNIILSTWMSTQSEINISPHNENENSGLILKKFSQSGTWELVSNSIQTLPNEDGLTRFQFTLKLKRLRTYYILNIILPVLFLSFTASLVFFLPADAGEKIGMGITVLLAYAVYLTIIADNMPQTSLQVSYLAVYLTILLGLTAMGVVLAVVVLHIHHKSDDCKIGKRTETITRKLRILFCMYKLEQPQQCRWASNVLRLSPATVSCSLPSSEEDAKPVASCEESAAASPPPSYTRNNHEEEDEEEITWPKVAATVDRIMFLLTSCLIVVITVVFVPLLSYGA
ncbi:neuronal acetylcholine receptor subunit alpha-7 [Elysia marginata]|uniref:Neuronal acetylcholine receptor subunit alpha-7 n=1 Tax=Elysia marginata TaxID=1093978 RepID=A0AAV4FRD6_9GAST|nr:neuronal acetylcholine receptor subunit alpha-7 [Elysia marginata]